MVRKGWIYIYIYTCMRERENERDIERKENFEEKREREINSVRLREIMISKANLILNLNKLRKFDELIITILNLCSSDGLPSDLHFTMVKEH